jgi:hypothetical protein
VRCARGSIGNAARNSDELAAIDVLHHQVKLAVFSDTAVQHPCDIGMTETGENLALLAEPLAEKVGHKGQVNQFDGDLLLKLPVGAMREIYGPHAATAD